MRLCGVMVGPNPTTAIFLKREIWTHTGRTPCDDRQTCEHHICKPRNTKIDGHHQKLEEAGKDSPLGLQRECGLLTLDFRLLASRPVWELISVVLSYPFCGKLLQQPKETNTHSQQFLKLDDSPLFCCDCSEKHPDGLLKNKQGKANWASTCVQRSLLTLLWVYVGGGPNGSHSLFLDSPWVKNVFLFIFFKNCKNKSKI